MKQYSLNKKLIDDEKRWTLSGKDNTGQSFFCRTTKWCLDQKDRINHGHLFSVQALSLNKILPGSYAAQGQSDAVME